MGRPLRYHAPGTYHLITSRCHQARFLLRPDPALNRAVLEWLARAQQHWPGVRVFAVCIMSNHLHLLVQDAHGELAPWTSYFLGNLARAVNRIRGRQGHVFARRYSAEAVLDERALVDRLVYTVTNPVQARLCARSSDWPGVVLWSRTGGVERYGIGARDAHPAPVVIHPLGGSEPAAVSLALAAREQQLRKERLGARRGVLGRSRVLSQHWADRPRRPKRSPRPLCHASEARLRRSFAQGFRAFTDAFRDASSRLRQGRLDVAFPPWSYPPGRPLVRAALRAQIPLA